MSAYIRMDTHRNYRIIILSVNIIKLIDPHLSNVARALKTIAVGARLLEHHRRKVIQIPACRDLYQVGYPSAYQRLHPVFRVLGIIDLRPAVTDPQIIRMEIVVHQTVVVNDPMVDQQLVRNIRELPPGRIITNRLLAAQLLDQINTFFQYCRFLGCRHRHRILMGVPVKRDLAACVRYRLHLLRKAFNGMSRDKPGTWQIVFFQHLQDTGRTYFSRENTSGNISR